MVQKKMQKLSLSLLILFLGLSSGLFAQSTGEITGKITEKGTDKPLEFVTVYLEGENTIKNTETDSLGNFTIKPIKAGTYKMTVHMMSYQDVVITDVVIRTNKTTRVDAELGMALALVGKDIPEITGYTIPLIDNENIQTGAEVSGSEMKMAPITTPTEYIATVAGVIQGENGDIQMRGARAGTTAYFLEGMRVHSINGIPLSAIEHMEVITGGIPAKYGDTTGGVVIVTLK